MPPSTSSPGPPSPSTPLRVSERTIIFLIGAVQFINILDFVMVMPLGPDFARALGIPTSHIGYIGGAYTAAAALAGLIGSLFLDRFDRRPALAVSMLGLVLGTAAGALAVDTPTLMLARVLAGFFGGPATSLSFSIIADVIPPARRGKAMGAVMGAFSVASVLGVPAGLRLATWGSWRTPFLVVAALGLAVTIFTFVALPPLRGHIDAARGERATGFLELLSRPIVLLSYSMTATTMMAGFILIPNISAYVQHNLGYPRARLDLLYMAGGVVSFAAMRTVGRLVDRYGSFRVGLIGTTILLITVYFSFYSYIPGTPVMGMFIFFMLAMAFRNVPYNTLTSKVPLPRERARFMSLQSAIQHAASAAGAFASSRILSELPGGKLVGMPTIAALSMTLTALLPVLLFIVESRVRDRDAAAGAPPLPGPPPVAEH